jgi:radical SAM protein with 4Fe4S-binding SPASM domain
MPVVVAEEVINQCARTGVPSIKFNFRGEATLHPAFSYLVKYAQSKRKFYDILINTNGNGPEKSIDGLAACTKVMVSLDSLIPETYIKMRKGGDLNKAKKCIHRLLEIGHKNVWARRVITDDNRHEPFAQDCRNEFGESIHIGEHFVFERGNTKKRPKKLERTYCGYPSQRLIVTVNGNVLPCCVDYNETMVIGNIDHDCISRVWEGHEIEKLRKELKSNIFKHKTCKKCSSWMSYHAPERDFVQDVEEK